MFMKTIPATHPYEIMWPYMIPRQYFQDSCVFVPPNTSCPEGLINSTSHAFAGEPQLCCTRRVRDSRYYMEGAWQLPPYGFSGLGEDDEVRGEVPPGWRPRAWGLADKMEWRDLLRGDLDELNMILGRVMAAINNLRGGFDVMREDLASLSRMAYTNIENLRTRVDALERIHEPQHEHMTHSVILQEITGLRGEMARVSDALRQIDELRTQVQQASTDLVSLRHKADQIAEQLKPLEERLQPVESEVARLKKTLYTALAVGGGLVVLAILARPKKKAGLTPGVEATS